MKKKLVLIAALVLIVTSVFVTSAMATGNLGNNDLERIETQSVIEYNKFLKACDKTSKYIDPSKVDYPDYYAGAYLNDDKELIILVTDDSENNQSELKSNTENENLIIKKAKYSYNHLNTVMKKISDYLIKYQESKDPLFLSIKDAAVFDDKNCILVHLKDLNEETIKLFKNKICDSDAIIFEKEGQPVVPYASIKAGQKITAGSTNLSMGFRCKRDLGDGTYEYGFVTAAHGVLKGNDVKIGSTVIGAVTARAYGGSTDASFVKITNSNYSASNSINGTSLSLYSGAYYSGIVGSTIKKSGYASGVTSGEITNTNWAGTIGGIPFTNLVLTNLVAEQGDSGGIVFSNDSPSPFLSGIIAGGNGTSTAYVKWSSIMTDLDILHY